MCLAAAYKNKEAPENLICKFVSNIQLREDQIVLTDLLGETVSLPGKLHTVDLVKNIVIIDDK